MKNDVLVLRFTKTKAGGRFKLVIDTNTPSISGHAVHLPFSTIPGTVEWDGLHDQIFATLQIVFGIASRSENFANKSGIEYKCVFSNKCIGIGNISLDDNRIETTKELILPMSEDECSFVFDCIPTHLSE